MSRVKKGMVRGTSSCQGAMPAGPMRVAGCQEVVA